MFKRTKGWPNAYLATAACAGLLLAGAGLATALGASASSTPSTTTVSAATAIKAPAPGSARPELSAEAREAFAIFAQPATSNEDLSFVEEAVRGDHDLDLDTTSVRLAQSTGAMQVMVAGDSESVCPIQRIPGESDGGGCATVASAVTPATPIISATAFPPGETSHPGGELAVVALFPNGTSNAAVVTADGNVTLLNIVNNTVALIATEESTLSWTGPEGRTYTAPLPH